ncbi:hypothetical protein H257_04701 [Aphanomyces astaci]|uniref:Uncharacterized protein n=1 Tax=Aphanomyces astaci TaxID=112090 RepID=W4GUD2_APHAT|nr:hypothetical protein H257_04701 [Aphanomyces astaci]ETV82931.1 hypothetical protein H257_04701 [Aphanomyces astaci]|eukprot:XP_009827602.1 hypothetical protein H257_04701 [Aphanomyces astaci]
MHVCLEQQKSPSMRDAIPRHGASESSLQRRMTLAILVAMAALDVQIVVFSNSIDAAVLSIEKSLAKVGKVVLVGVRLEKGGTVVFRQAGVHRVIVNSAHGDADCARKIGLWQLPERSLATVVS